MSSNKKLNYNIEPVYFIVNTQDLTKISQVRTPRYVKFLVSAHICNYQLTLERFQRG